MNFEVFQALCDLNQRTPEYFVTEIFTEGDMTVKRQAQAALRSLDPDAQSNRVLRSMLKLIENREDS